MKKRTFDTAARVVAGVRQVRRMRLGEAARQIARSRGGQVAQSTGVGHRWTSEEARKAGAKGLRTRDGKMNHVWHRKIGGRSRRRPKVDHAALRQCYSTYYPINPQRIWYGFGEWYQECFGKRIVLSERQALTKLGHLKPRTKGFVPDPGTQSATVTSRERNDA